MWIASQDGKVILEAVKFERFGSLIEITGLGGYFLNEEYGTEYEAMVVMDHLRAGLTNGSTFLLLPRRVE